MFKKIDNHMIFMMTECEECAENRNCCAEFQEGNHPNIVVFLMDRWKGLWIPSQLIQREPGQMSFVDENNGISWTKIYEIPDEAGMFKQLIDCIRQSFLKDGSKDYKYEDGKVTVIRPIYKQKGN